MRGNFYRGFSKGLERGAAIYANKQKIQAQKEKDRQEQKAADEKKRKENLSKYHKDAMATVPKESPDWHYHNKIVMDIKRENLSEVDPNVAVLTNEGYREQFVKYKPEDYEEWKFWTRSPYSQFHPTKDEIEKGRAFTEFQKTKEVETVTQEKQVTIGEEREEDTKPDLKRLEKMRLAAERWTKIIRGNAESLESMGMTKEDLKDLEKLKLVKDMLSGRENIPIMTIDEFKSTGYEADYQRKIAQYNLAQREQGVGLQYQDIAPMDEERYKELGYDKIEIPETSYSGKLDSLTKVLDSLRTKYPDVDFTKKITEEELGE